MEYISLKNAASNKGMSERRISKLCETGRIKGAVKVDSGAWLIPKEYISDEDEEMSVSIAN